MNHSDSAKLILDAIPSAMGHIRSEMRMNARPELTVPQFRVLARLSRSQVTNGELAEWIGVSPPTMTRTVDSLVKRGLIKRGPQSVDRRQIMLCLTEKGTAAFNRIRSAVQVKLAHRLSKLSSEKVKQLENGLSILREIFE